MSSTKDVFGFDADDITSSSERATIDDYKIVHITPAEGWRVLVEDPTTGSNRELGLACFALVEIVDTEAQTIDRLVRPMMSIDDGTIEDVAMFDEFICLVPPGVSAKDQVAYAVRRRALKTS